MANLAINGGKAVCSASQKWASWPVSDAADGKLVAKIATSNRWSYDGKYEWEFAEKFTAYQKGKFGLCCANGTVGIQLALEALGIGAYDEVIVPGMTWQATAAAVADVNALPVLVDVEPDTWNLDLDAVEDAITPQTRAVIVVHLYGCTTDISRLVTLCKKRGLFLIEDCAHQHGTFWKKQGVGTFGDVSSWSFQESKVLSSGEGGFNMCQTKEMFYKLYSLRNCGRHYEADPAVFGLKKPAPVETALQSGNYRLTEFQAAILLGGLKRLDKQVKQRDAMAKYLNAKLDKIPGMLPMRRRPEITQQSYFNFAFRIDSEALEVTNRQFCAALNAELNTGDAFEPPYDPLNDCQLYKPRTKKRHHLGAKYWKALNPQTSHLAVCEEASRRNGITVHHSMLMNKKSDISLVTEAIKKLVDNVAEVRKIKIKGEKKYQALSR